MLKLPKFEGKVEGSTAASAANATGKEVEVIIPGKKSYRFRSHHRGYQQAPVSTASPADKAALQAALQNKFVKHHVGMPKPEDMIDGNNYVVGKDGLYLVRKNAIGLFVTKADKIPFIDDDKNPVEGFHMALENKLPHEMLLQTISFFKKVVNEKGNAEAMIQVLLKEEEDTSEYFMNIADQEVSGAFVKFKRDANLEEANTLVLDIHSHNTMNAFFSATDNADEKEARIYGVIGKLNQDWPDMKFRAGDGKGGWIELDPFDVFETPDVDVAVPEEWMSKVHKPGSGVFGEHSKPKQTTFPTQPVNPYYRNVYDPYFDGWERRPWNTGEYPKVRRFGATSKPGQDRLEEFDWDRWEKETYEDESIQVDPHAIPEIDASIDMLIEGSETLDKESVKAMWLTLIDKLDPIGREELAETLKELL